jgi:phosphinothricin acetyltransferase
MGVPVEPTLAVSRERIRAATPEDAVDIREIYAPYVTDSVISFEVEVPSVDEVRSRVGEGSRTHPWLILERDGVVVGYAYAAPHRSRAAYAWSADCSVYIRQGGHRKGAGRLLYTKLFSMLREQGVANVFAGISLPNEASVGLHESMGFRPVGVYEGVGFKFGQWWSTGWWQLVLQRPSLPSPLGAVPGV